MELVKRTQRVLVMSLIPQGGKPKDAVELVFKGCYLEPAVTQTLLREGYAIGIAMDDREVYVEEFYEECAPGGRTGQGLVNQKAIAKKSAPARKPAPKKAPALKPEPAPEELVLESEPSPAPTPAKKNPYDKGGKKRTVVTTDDKIDEPEEIIIE